MNAPKLPVILAVGLLCASAALFVVSGVGIFHQIRDAKVECNRIPVHEKCTLLTYKHSEASLPPTVHYGAPVSIEPYRPRTNTGPYTATLVVGFLNVVAAITLFWPNSKRSSLIIFAVASIATLGCAIYNFIPVPDVIITRQQKLTCDQVDESAICAPLSDAMDTFNKMNGAFLLVILVLDCISLWYLGHQEATQRLIYQENSLQ